MTFAKLTRGLTAEERELCWCFLMALRMRAAMKVML